MTKKDELIGSAQRNALYISLPYVLTRTRDELDCQVSDLKTNLSPFEEYCALYKLKYLIEGRMSYMKEKAKNDIPKNTPELYGVEAQVRTVKKYEYSQYTAESIKNIEKDIKVLQEKIKHLKKTEEIEGIALLASNEPVLAIKLL